MNTTSFGRLAGCGALALIASAGHAQTIHPETEPNDSKAQALANFNANPVTLSPGDGVTGGSTASTGAGLDYFVIRTPAAPPGVYRHRMVLSATPAGHTATLRSLNQTAASTGVWPCSIGTPGTTDSTAQTHALSGTDRVVQWYGFGKQEQVYYRVLGTASTTAPYTSILHTDAAPIQDIGTWQTGSITITTAPPGHGNDCDMAVYDADFNPVPGFANDGATINGGHTANLTAPTFLRRDFAPGVYHMAISSFDVQGELGSPCDDNRRTGFIMDFPGSVVCSSATAPFHCHFQITDAWGQVQINTTKAAAFEVRWVKFTVGETSPAACCRPDLTCSYVTPAQCAAVNGVSQGPGSDCGSVTCPAGACCLANQTCTYTTPQACPTGAGAAFMGNGTDCSTVTCPLPGACCLANGTCTVMAQGLCLLNAGATYGGHGTTCAACPAQPAGQWFARADAPEARVGSAGAVVGNTFYLMAGAPSNGIRGTACWKFDILNNAWSPIAPLPHSGAPAPQQGGISNIQGAAVGTDVYIVGGYPGVQPPLARVLRYDTVSDFWEEVFTDPYPTPIFAAALVGHGGKLYSMGGHTALSTPTAACYVYDPAAPAGTRWSPIAALDVPRAGMAGVAVGDTIYCLGGEATDQSRVDVYSIASNSWSLGPAMGAERGGCAAYNLSGKPYAASGGWATYIASGEALDGGAWGPGPAVLNGLRSMAYGGSATWLVRSTGFNGVYRAYTETLRLGAGSPPCYPNCDASTQPPVLNVQDFSCFLTRYAAGESYANCDGSTQPPVLNVQDFSCFLTQYAAGCSAP